MSSQLARHAHHLEVARTRFVTVEIASAAIAHDESAYGLLCRWITEDFGEKHARQDELCAFVDENLRLIGASLRKTADVAAPAVDPRRLAAGPALIAPVPVVGVAVGGWTMAHVEPLRDVLDQLTGKPNVITSHAATWHNIAEELYTLAEELEDYVEYDTPGWHGDDAVEHQRLMGNNIDAIKGLSSISVALAEITESVGVLVAQTRRIVRDMINDLVALAGPLPGTFEGWASRIAVYAVALDITLTHLDKRLNG